MSLLVTGGAGFIGSHFVKAWLAQDDGPVITLDALTYAGNLNNLASLHGDARHVFVQGDICDRALVDGLLATHRPRAVVHFAAESHVDRSIDSPAAFIRTNVEGTFCLLEAARRHVTALPDGERHAFRFLHVSTDEVFGSLPPGAPPFGESHPARPNNPYAASKAASDHLVRSWHHTYGLPTLITNCCNNYGPFQRPDKLMPLVITKALRGEALPLYGDGLQIRDWLHVRDHNDALRTVLARGQVGETYNVGGSCELSNLEITQRVCALLDELRPDAAGPHARLICHVSDRPAHDRRYAIDPRKIEHDLGWRAMTPFDQGLRDTVQWYLAGTGHPA